MRNIVDDCFAVINADDFYGRETIAIAAEHLRRAEAERHRNARGAFDCCMVGFRLGNTLTENGTVSRGICTAQDGRLLNVTERTAIRRSADGTHAEYEEDGAWHELELDAIASMNCFGLVPEVFGHIEQSIRALIAAGEYPERLEL